MALKDLVADSGKITEEMIEEIIADYVRYELNPNAIVFTPQGVALNAESRVLVYLVAVMGWRYVLEDGPQTNTKPADLEGVLGIPGNTLRPILKKLKDTHLLALADGHYSARPTNLNAVANVIRGEKSNAFPKRQPNKTKKTSAVEKRENAKPEKVQRRSSPSVKSSLTRLVEQGFFEEFRTLSQIVQRLHELAIIAKVTAISGPIADFVRDGILQRKKIKEGSKEVWAYKTI